MELCHTTPRLDLESFVVVVSWWFSGGTLIRESSGHQARSVARPCRRAAFPLAQLDTLPRDQSPISLGGQGRLHRRDDDDGPEPGRGQLEAWALRGPFALAARSTVAEEWQSGSPGTIILRVGGGGGAGSHTRSRTCLTRCTASLSFTVTDLIAPSLQADRTRLRRDSRGNCRSLRTYIHLLPSTQHQLS